LYVLPLGSLTCKRGLNDVSCSLRLALRNVLDESSMLCLRSKFNRDESLNDKSNVDKLSSENVFSNDGVP
jgi:hypothetical protein